MKAEPFHHRVRTVVGSALPLRPYMWCNLRQRDNPPPECLFRRGNNRLNSVRGLWGAVFAAIVFVAPAQAQNGKFEIVEATISLIQGSILSKQITTVEVVTAYLARIKAYNGRCVNELQGVLGPVTPIQGLKSLNALMTLNLRPTQRKRWGFEDRKARSMTDAADSSPTMPDALETAAEQDKQFQVTGKLVGPLHGTVMSIKDVLDTYDMRTTSGADAPYANDRPPVDSTVVKRLRDAGAIILAKANLGEYASGSRSSFGGSLCNPYDTMRDPGGSSGGSAASVAANLVTCSISEEGAPSIRMPSRLNNIVGLSGTQGLVSRDGLIGAGPLNDRIGPACRTVEDTARVLDAIVGYDPADDLTVYSVGRIPKDGYVASTRNRDLRGMRIGVLREYMNKSLFTVADAETIDVVDQAIAQLKSLGAVIVDPGATGDLFQSCLAQYIPQNMNAGFIRQLPDLFPQGGDHLSTLLDLYFQPSKVPSKVTMRDLGPVGDSVGESKYYFNRYLRKRGDANIKDLSDLIAKSRFYQDEFSRSTRFRDVKGVLEDTNKAGTLNVQTRNANRMAIQQTLMQCMKLQNLDAITYPTGNIPPTLIKELVEPDVNNRSHQAWTLIGQMGFPSMTVPAGFTTQVYDRIRDAAAPGGTKLSSPTSAKLPVGIDFIAMPFDEATLFKIGSAFEGSSKHRSPPPLFGPLTP